VNYKEQRTIFDFKELELSETQGNMLTPDREFPHGESISYD